MAAKLIEVKEQLEKSLHDDSTPFGKGFKKLEELTGLKRSYLFLGFVAIIALWLTFGYAAQLVCNMVGFAYPAYASIHALETKRTDDDKKWLTYWVVFAVFSIIEFFTDFITGWLPLYWLVKCVFMVWLMIPTELNGSIIIYNKIILPNFLTYHRDVDNTINKVKEATKNLMKDE